MTTAQKIIKNLALAFACVLIVSIISGIFSALYALSGILGLQKEDKKINDEMSMINFENSEVATLDIDVAFTNLIIKKGEFLIAETNNEDINCKQNNQNLQIKEKQHNWFSRDNKGDLVLYIPENLEFEKVRINAGAGKITIEKLNTQNLYLELGAGDVYIENVIVTGETKINGGVGKAELKSCEINNLKANLGIGEFFYSGKVTGKGKIDSGVGAINIKLTDNKKNYTIDVSKGLGNVTLDSQKLEMDRIYGTGKNYLAIDGGIGEIKIEFKE